MGSRQQLSKVQLKSVTVGDSEIKPISSVHSLGAWSDKNLSMSIDVSKVCSKAFRGLYSIRQIRKYLSEDATKVLVHAFVTSHLDYCMASQNTSMIGCRGLLMQLPALSAWYPSSITSHQSFVIYIAYQSLTELNVKYCYSSTELSWLWPLSYLKKLLSFKESGSYNWRSNTSHELKVSTTKCKTLGDRAFVRVGPSPWNPFPFSYRE